MNHVTLMGNVTREIELKHTQGGTELCDFGLAINKKWKDNAGNQKESVCFVDITCWGKTADIASRYVQKGHKVLIEGELTLDQWEDKNGGGKRSKLKVTCQRLHLLPNGKREQQAASGEGSQETQYYDDKPAPTTTDGGDVPF